MTVYFANREEAGKKLAEAISAYKEQKNTVVLAFYGVGDAYGDFGQTQDEEVKGLLAQAAAHYDLHSKEVGESACECA